MDSTTRKVIIVLASVLGTAFVVIGIFTFVRGDSLFMGILNALQGLMCFTAAVLVARRAPRV